MKRTGGQPYSALLWLAVTSFKNSVALVTGGASGIGRALCQRLAAQGARVVLSDVDEAGAQALAAELVAAGHSAEAAALDVRDADAVKAWIEGAAATHGRLDYVFNNAGVGLLGETFEQSLEDWRWVIDVNLNGVVHGVMAAYPIMVAQGHGHIVNTASLSGLVPAPHFAAYSMTKHAVVGLSRSLREEARALGVRVSCACPGFIQTPIMENARLTKLDRGKAHAEVMVLANTAESCARAILRGVRRDEAVIVVTGHGKVIGWLQRYAPWLVRMIARNAAKGLRARCRSEPLEIAAKG